MQRPSRIDTMTDHPYNRRAFLLSSASSAAVPWLGATDAFADDEVLQSVPHSVPQSVKALWADFDPRNDPLETEILREWTEDGGVFRHTVASGSDRLGTRATRASIKSGDASASGGNIESILGGGHPSSGQKRLDGG